jgi:WD40 repeat protein
MVPRTRDVQVWDVEKKIPVAAVSLGNQPARSLVYSRDGSALYIALNDGGLVRIAAESYVPEQRRPGCDVSVSTLAVMPDNLIVGYIDGTIALLDPVTLKEKARICAHNAQVTSLATAPNGLLFATGSADGTAKLWSITNRASLATIDGHEVGVTALAFSKDSTILLSASNRTETLTGSWGGLSSGFHTSFSSAKCGYLKRTKVESGEALRRLSGNIGPISALTTHPQNTSIYVAAGPCVLEFNVEADEWASFLGAMDTSLAAIGFLGDGSLVTLDSRGKMSVWSLDAGLGCLAMVGLIATMIGGLAYQILT